MSTPETIVRADEPIRPLKRVEYERLAKEGFFDDEKVELLFGMVVPMTPIDWALSDSAYHVRRALERGLGERARVYQDAACAASDISMPQPDLLVIPNVPLKVHPTNALLVVEVSRSSLRRDKGPKAVLYGLAEVVEYWIVDHVHDVVEVYRDRDVSGWRTKRTYGRDETIAMTAFPDVTVAVSEILPPPKT